MTSEGDGSAPDGEDPAPAVAAAEEQLRWLHAFHENRAERFEQRAATLLGLDGVVLGLLFAGVSQVQGDRVKVALLVVTLLLIGTSSYLGLWVLQAKSTETPDPAQSRRWARSAASRWSREAVVRARSVEALARVKDLDEDSLVDEAMRLADARGEAFVWQTWATFAALVTLAVLVVLLAL